MSDGTIPFGADKPLIIACVSDNPNSQNLLRAAKRYAERLQCEWRVLHVRTPDFSFSTKRHRARQVNVIKNLTVASEMGAKTKTVEAQSFEQGLQRYISSVHQEGRAIKAILVGEASISQATLFTNGTHTSPVVKKIHKVVPSHITLQTVHVARNQHVQQDLLDRLILSLRYKPTDFAYALCAVTGATLLYVILNWLMPDAFKTQNQSVFYFGAVALVACRWGLVPSLITAALSYLTLDFFFYKPKYALLVSTPPNATYLVLLLIFAVLITIFAGGRRSVIERGQEEIRRLQALFNVYRNSIRETTYESAVRSIHRDLCLAMRTEVVFFFPSSYEPDKLNYAYPLDTVLDAETLAARDACWQDARPTGYGTYVHPKSTHRFKPLTTSTSHIGVIGFRIDNYGDLNPILLELLSSVTDLVALILERISIEQRMEEARVQSEREKLRSMLLSSVSHDLKTPLASIIGSLSVHQNIGAHLPDEQKQELLTNALDEAHRLDSFITNILDMTRLESKQLRFKQEWATPSELLHNVLKRMRNKLRHHPIRTNELSGVEICADTMLTEQVLQNLIDNATKYTTPGTAIEITTELKDNVAAINVRDFGTGIPEDALENIFNKYTRLKKQDTKIAGTGLGLAIARTIMREQGGDVVASNHPGGGAVFTVIFPMWRHEAAAQGMLVAEA